MKKILFLVLFYFFVINLLFAEEQNIGKYKFEIYYLIKGQMKKNKKIPDFGWRILKAFPVSVKEYVYSSQVYEYKSEEISQLATKITENLSEARKKNAVHIANEIYRYINENIKKRDINKEIKPTAGQIYFSYKQVLKEKQGCDIEKCRLAVTLLRYFTIPARMVYINDRYAVEYFIMPLKGKGEWFLMDFEDNAEQQKEYSFPVYWHPLDCKEILNQMWDKDCYVDMLEVKNIFLSSGEREATYIYNQITTSAKNFDEIQTENYPEKGKFIVLKKILYELWLPKGVDSIKVNFILPFNSVDFFRTKYWWVKSIDEKLTVRMRRINTEVKPPQEGMIVTLPVEFSINYSN